MTHPRGWWLAAALVFWIALLPAGGCQAIVSSDVPAFQCSGTDLTACPVGNYCLGAGCVPCQKIDVCDGYDNDCNGKVDDGRLSDGDADGYSICGHIDDAGEIVGRDCDDTDPSVHPDAAEVCNGKDDNCDGNVDENTCPSGQTCAPKTGACVASACDPAVPASCSNGTVCDPGTRQCVVFGGRGLGDPCAADDECQAEAFCADARVLAGISTVSGAVCTKACCESKDCPSGFVCVGQGGGGNFCLKGDLLGRNALGNGRAGTTCAGARDCRSGSCVGGKCEDVCCSDQNCPGSGWLCRATSLTIGPRFTYGCAPSGGPIKTGGDCGSSASTRCERGVCSDPYQLCLSNCCNSSICGDGLYCLDTPPLGHPDARVLSCGGLTGSGTLKATGESCTAASDCRGSRCYADPKTKTSYCSDVCCVDTDCPNNLRCLPRLIDTQKGLYSLRCQRL